MKKLIKGLFFIIFIASLGLNALLIYNAKFIKKDNNYDIVEKRKDTEYTKNELGDLFKEYQTNAGLANPENVAVWEVNKITYKGFFISDGRKVYFIEETFSCLEGVNCVNASNAKVDDQYNTTATYVVAVNDNVSSDVKFYILDESILENNDFNKEKEYDLK